MSWYDYANFMPTLCQLSQYGVSGMDVVNVEQMRKNKIKILNYLKIIKN